MYRSSMTHPVRRRIVNATLVVLLLHLVLVGSGYACGLTSHGRSAGDMPGMQMGGMQSNTTAPGSVPEKEAPCRLPWAPDGCQSMAACAPAAVKSVPIVFFVPLAQPGAIPSPVPAIHTSVIRTPDPRPPRA